MNIVPKLTLTLTAALAQLNGVIFISPPAVAEEINYASPNLLERDTLCSKFPLNSRCEDFEASTSTSQIYQLDRNSFCDRFHLNSQCQQPPLQLIKLNLDRSGKNNEWVELEKRAGKIKLRHTTSVKDDLVSGLLNGALGLVPFPFQFVEVNKYDWKNHQVTKVSFKSDRCNAKSCVITGKDTLVLPENTNVFSGLFTIDYQEKDLRRSLSFRIPEDTNVKTVETITVEISGH